MLRASFGDALADTPLRSDTSVAGNDRAIPRATSECLPPAQHRQTPDRVRRVQSRADKPRLARDRQRRPPLPLELLVHQFERYSEALRNPDRELVNTLPAMP